MRKKEIKEKKSKRINSTGGIHARLIVILNISITRSQRRNLGVFVKYDTNQNNFMFGIMSCVKRDSTTSLIII